MRTFMQFVEESIESEWGALLSKSSRLSDYELDSAIDQILTNKTDDEIKQFLFKKRLKTPRDLKRYIKKVVANIRF